MFSDAHPLTGRSVLAVTLLAFGTIIGANLALTFYALHSFPGLEVENPYVASQSFDADARAQRALGWSAVVDEVDGQISVSLLDASGSAVQPRGLAVMATRPTDARHDQLLSLVFDGTAYLGAEALAAGRWRIRIRAAAPDGTTFRTIRDVTVGAAP